jgi:PAS domain S-box-containing protein
MTAPALLIIDDQPVMGDEQTTMEALQTTNHRPAPAAELLRVLLVEDDAEDARRIVRELTRAGIEATVRQVQTALDMEQALLDDHCDVVIAEYQLPQFGAPAALRTLQRSGRDVPFIVVSRAMGEETAVEVMRAGAHDFMIKGTLTRLGAVLRRELEEAHERQRGREIEADLRVSQARLALLVEGVQDYAIGMIDPTGRIVTFNSAARHILGVEVQALLGQPYTSLFAGSPVETSLPSQLLDEVAARGRLQVEGWRRKGATQFWADTVITALRDANNELVGFCDMTRDATERWMAEQERAQLLAREQAARAQAESAVRARDEFLTIASHELRTPLTILMTAAQLVLRSQQSPGLSPERLERSLAEIVRSTRRLADLTRDLLDVSRLETGRLPLHPASIDLWGLLSDVVTRHRQTVPATHAIDLVEPPRGIAFPVVGDSARLEQVLVNLLDNAVKYSPRGGVVQVELTPNPAADGYLLRVQDSGIGLTPGASEIIFQPFGRAPGATSRNLPGMGLGLYICRQIVEAHQGRIWAESGGENDGTRMYVNLPAEGVSLTIR